MNQQVVPLRMMVCVATGLTLCEVYGQRLPLSPNCGDVSEEKFKASVLLEKFIGVE